ncbi:MAG: hypothetical protein DRO11_10005 [Methanobacteriota archaeon]|nr:MAG: hypothetical protein DRO11_10005 [Euryarchaeota archaeon]
MKSVKRTYYRHGQLESEAPYVDGKKHGIAKWYWENGQLRLETSYVNGKRYGTEKEYYKNGQLLRKVPCINDIIHGTAKWYYENGQLFGKISYGKKHGIEKWYYEHYDENGQLKKVFVYYNGQNVTEEVLKMNKLEILVKYGPQIAEVIEEYRSMKIKK